MEFRNQIYHKDCLEGLWALPEDCVDLVVTSPPYDDLRDYGGVDWNFENFGLIAKRLTAVLKPGGVIVWVVNDKTDGSESGTSFNQALYFMNNCGLWLHDTMIYQKAGSSYPAGDNSNRYSQVFEYMFVFSKGKPKTANLIRDVPNRWAGVKNWGKSSTRLSTGTTKTNKRKKPVAEFGVRSNIWKVVQVYGRGQSDNEAYEHEAVMPEAIARGHIQTWSNEGDLVLDPFMGSGTTIKVAKQEGRDYLGYEINKKYFDLSKRLISKVLF